MLDGKYGNANRWAETHSIIILKRQTTGTPAIDETDTQFSVNNSAVEAFVTEDQEMQRSVDLTA